MLRESHFFKMTACHLGTNLFERNDDDFKNLDPFGSRHPNDCYGRRSYSECNGKIQWRSRCQRKFCRTCAKRSGEGW